MSAVTRQAVSRWQPVVATGWIISLYLGSTGISASQACLLRQQESLLPNTELIQRAEALLDQLNTSDFAAAATHFDETMTRVMPVEALRKTWSSVEIQVGTYQKHGRPTAKQSGPYRLVTMPCDFEHASLELVVTFDKQSKIAGFAFKPSWQAPAYVDRLKFSESEMQIGEDPWQVFGTLTLPEGDGPFPAVVLIHGSGPQDRDESVGPNKPFRDLAQGLASRGIAVWRFDKRTLIHGKRFVELGKTTVWEESVADALLSVNLLRNQPKIDARRIFVLGHSWGGYLMPRIIQKDPRIAGAILLAGNTRSLSELMEDQMPYILGLDGQLSDEDQQKIADVRKAAEKIRNQASLQAMADGEILLGAPRDYYLDLFNYRPEQLAREVFSEALFLQGERDYQVTMQDDFATWQQAVGSKPGMTFKSYPQLNHLFMSGRGKSKPAEYQIPGHVDVQLIDDVASWIDSQE